MTETVQRSALEDAYAQLAPYQLLWREEIEVVASLARQLPSQSVVLEIGTANGGTAALLAMVLGAEATIYSADLNVSAIARQALAQGPVKLVEADSAAFAEEYRKIDGRPLDFIFIDGDHSLRGVYRDFEAWLPLLKTGARIAFHDYDPPRRGGVAHFGIQIFIDALRTVNDLSEFKHEFRIFSFRRAPGLTIPAPPHLRRAAEAAAGRTQTVLKEAEGLTDSELEMVLTGPFSASPWKEAELCYIIDELRRKRRPLLFSLARGAPGRAAGSKAMKFEELLYTLEEAFGPSPFPGLLPSADSVEELSRVLQREQVRLVVLNEIRGHLAAPEEDPR